MSLRILHLVLLAALALAPFGRIGAIEAGAAPNPQAMQMASHCADQPGEDDKDAMSIDCMIACAAATPAVTADIAPPPAAAGAAPAPVPAVAPAGIRPEAEPPPPRS